MLRLLIVAVVLVITGCASSTVYFKAVSPMIPNTASLPCCWQVYEKLEIDYQGEQLALSSAIAINDNELTVVILDPLGRRIFSVIQQGDHVQVDKSDSINKEFPVEWLLIGVYLRYMSEDGWFFKDSHWRVKRDGEYVQLVQNNKTKIILHESVIQSDTVIQLEYPDLNLNIKITTLQNQLL